MAQNEDQVATIIDISKLPSLPQTLIELINMCNNKDRDLKKIGTLIARDVSISARILQLANSAFIGARNSFADIEQAVIFLGIDTIRNLAISVSVQETFNKLETNDTLNIASFWYHSFLTAVLAKSFSQSAQYSNSSEAYLTGLLHDVGKLLLFTSFPDRYPLILEQECSGDMLPTIERDSLGVTHAEAGSLLISQWNLQQSITDAILSHHDDEEKACELDTLGKSLYAANRLSNSLVLSPSSPDTIAESLLGIDTVSLPVMIEEAREVVDKITESMGISAVAAPLARQEPSKRVPTKRTDLSRKVQSISTISGAVDNLLKAENLHRVVRVIEESFHLLFNIPCCLLLLPDVETGTMGIHVSTSNRHHGHDELSIPIIIGVTGLLADCLANSTILHATRFDGLAIDGLEDQCLRLLDAEGLVAIPIPLEDGAQGILVAGISNAESVSIIAQQETLSLLAGQIGMRIRLERLQRRVVTEQINALSRIARQIAHEINNPIATLQNYLFTLGKKLDNQSSLHDDLQLISSEIQYIASITEQLNDLTSTTICSTHEQVNLNQIVTKAADFYLQSLLPESTITISLDVDKNLPTTRANAAGIRQIVGNLIKNGIEALNNSGTLTIRTSVWKPTPDTDAAIRLTVEDNGPGPPTNLADSIFTAGVTTKGAGHVGLGLAITRKLVHELGGTISYSSGKTAGTKFTISLPIAPSTPGQEQC